jgi:hypothetical protein
MTVIWAYTLNRVLVVFPKNDIQHIYTAIGDMTSKDSENT